MPDTKSQASLIKRKCNMHDDCDAADQAFKVKYPNGRQTRYAVVYLPGHCDDECCEECFGH